MRQLRQIFGPGVLAVSMLTGGTAAAETEIGTFGDWIAYTQGSGSKLVCYMGSLPKKSKGKYKKRGETFVLVTHRPAEKSTNVVSVQAGYTYKEGAEVTLAIGKTSVKLFTDGGHAFAYDSKADDSLVKTMIRGANLVVKGTSSRGTLTTDTYSLKGFTAAYRAISKACKV